MTTPFRPIAEVVCDLRRTTVYEHGWQSWSPTGVYPARGTSPRPQREHWQATGYRPGKPGPATGFQGEGLIAVAAGDGAPVTAYYAPDPWREVTSIRVEAIDDRLLVAADGEVATLEGPTLHSALVAVADLLAERGGVGPLRSLGPGWCSWYCYWDEVTEENVLANLAALDRLDLDVPLVQVDDGHQAEIGDWLARSSRFGPLAELGGRIRDTGREAGIWTAPFLVGTRSRIAVEHPDWLVDDAVALPQHWGQEVRVLDVTHPGAAEHLHGVYAALVEAGFTYHKIDFCYAGALAGGRHADASPLDAFAEGLRIIRAGTGDAATILGCGAPLLPSIGRVDAMRTSPDISPAVEPDDGDLSQPGQRAATLAGRARAWQHGRWWVADPDCLIARPEVEQREAWVSHLSAVGGLMVSSDPLDTLDAWGLEATRRLLLPSGTTPVDVAPVPADGEAPASGSG